MSYTIDLLAVPISNDDKIAWSEIEKYRDEYYDDKREISAKFIELHDVLISLYPCLSSVDDDDDSDECPWADGPMIRNFSHEMGMLAIRYSRVDDVLPFIIFEANKLGITVADGQDGSIHRPIQTATSTKIVISKKPWWQFW